MNTNDLNNTNQTQQIQEEQKTIDPRFAELYGSKAAKPVNPSLRIAGSTYIFVVSLILMIFLALRTLLTLVSVAVMPALVEHCKLNFQSEELLALVEQSYGITSLLFLLVLGAFIPMLILFLKSIKVRSFYVAGKNKLSACTGIFVCNIIYISFLLLYIIAEHRLATINDEIYKIEPAFYGTEPANNMGSTILLLACIGLTIPFFIKINSIKKAINANQQTPVTDDETPTF